MFAKHWKYNVWVKLWISWICTRINASQWNLPRWNKITRKCLKSIPMKKEKEKKIQCILWNLTWIPNVLWNSYLMLLEKAKQKNDATVGYLLLIGEKSKNSSIHYWIMNILYIKPMQVHKKFEKNHVVSIHFFFTKCILHEFKL